MKIIIINKVYQFLSNDTKPQNKVSYFDKVGNYNYTPPCDVKPQSPPPDND